MKLMSKKSVAGRLDVSTRTIERMVESGEFPAATHKIGGQPRWFEPVVENWILLTRVSSEIPDTQTATNRDKPRHLATAPKNS